MGARVPRSGSWRREIRITPNVPQCTRPCSAPNTPTNPQRACAGGFRRTWSSTCRRAPMHARTSCRCTTCWPRASSTCRLACRSNRSGSTPTSVSPACGFGSCDGIATRSARGWRRSVTLRSLRRPVGSLATFGTFAPMSPARRSSSRTASPSVARCARPALRAGLDTGRQSARRRACLGRARWRDGCWVRDAPHGGSALDRGVPFAGLAGRPEHGRRPADCRPLARVP